MATKMWVNIGSGSGLMSEGNDNDNDNDNDNETILLPWSYIISIQYTKQHTCNQYNIF